MLDVCRSARVWAREKRGRPQGAVPEMLFPKLPEGTEKLEDVFGVEHWQGFVVNGFTCSEYGWMDKKFESVVVGPVMVV